MEEAVKCFPKHALSVIHNQRREMHYIYIHKATNVHEQVVSQHENEVE